MGDLERLTAVSEAVEWYGESWAWGHWWANGFALVKLDSPIETPSALNFACHCSPPPCCLKDDTAEIASCVMAVCETRRATLEPSDQAAKLATPNANGRNAAERMFIGEREPVKLIRTSALLGSTPARRFRRADGLLVSVDRRYVDGLLKVAKPTRWFAIKRAGAYSVKDACVLIGQRGGEDVAAVMPLANRGWTAVWHSPEEIDEVPS